MGVLSPGSVGHVSLMAMTPAALVMVRAVGARGGNTGAAGGATTRASPKVARTQLILLKNKKPVSGPLVPQRGVDVWACAAAFQASCCS